MALSLLHPLFRHVAVLAALMLMAGCASLSSSGSDHGHFVARSVTVNGIHMPYQVFVPAHAARQPGALPVVLFLHGSSGLGLKAIGEWQQWLAAQGIASVAPDSFALPDHVTYKSPIDKASYERIHALRASEIAPALAEIQTAPWADTSKLVLAGTSEGAVPVARYAGREFAARMLFAWSCEPNHFVTEPRNAFAADKPVLASSAASIHFSHPPTRAR